MVVAVSVKAARSRSCFGKKASCDCILYQSKDARFGCNVCTKLCWTRCVPSSLVSNPRLACAVCRLLRPVFRESREEPFKGAFSNLIVDFSSPFCLQDCVVMHREDVVDTADAKAFAKECKILSWHS